MLQKLEGSNARPSAIAAAYAGLGELDQAFEWLERTLEPGEMDDFWFRWSDVEYASLRSDPRFQDLLLRMNLVP